jgi:hypothetical protein
VRLYGQIGNALIDAREGQEDAYTAIKSVLSWDNFVNSMEEAEELTHPAILIILID